MLIEIPDEVFEAEFKGEIDYTPVPVQRTAPDPAAVREAVRMLLAAKNPVLWGGAGVHYAEAGAQLAALAELVPAPVVTTNPGKSAIPDSHPLSLGASTRSRGKHFVDFMAKADLVFAVGSSLTRTPFGPSVPPGKTIIHSTNEAGDINKEYRVDLGLGRRCRADARRADRRSLAAEGPGRRQCAGLAQGGGRGRQEGVARQLGQIPQFRRDAA